MLFFTELRQQTGDEKGKNKDHNDEFVYIINAICKMLFAKCYLLNANCLMMIANLIDYAYKYALYC